MTQTVVTRFAPSPTGYLHIGGARTALFNWLYARHTGGKYLLRIEDTDRERSTPAATDALIDSLKWLGLEWDGEPISQFARAGRHREVARQLLAAGNAYRCYLSPAELEAMHSAIEAERKLAKQEKRAPGGPQTIQSPWRDRDPSEAPAGVAPVLRLRAPREGETAIDDVVQGRVVVPNTQLDDMIILRSDGSPIYNFAVVVDDHDMGITHVIRGVDHLTNAARQVQIYKALGWEPPVFAHVPMILGDDGKKLSKRHGAPGLESYRAMGFLPAGLRNYLARLGWSHGDDEIFSTEQTIEWFDIADINKAAARLDPAKMADVNAHYIRQSSDAELLRRIQAFLPEAEGGPALGARFAAAGWDRLAEALPSLKGRAKTLKELVDGAAYLIAVRPLVLEDKAAKALDAGARALLGRLLPQLEAAQDWRVPALEGLVRAFGEAEGARLGSVAQPLRAALTGRAVSPPVFDVMAALGREEVLARIRDQAS
ncbi:MAG TPA: glutamate--tRNA ligase [Hyphomicrobiaceae bacterium]|jgi:glutamyl-tRNA synthetase